MEKKIWLGEWNDHSQHCCSPTDKQSEGEGDMPEELVSPALEAAPGKVTQSRSTQVCSYTHLPKDSQMPREAGH